jgi:hypothetical protein
MATLPEPSRTLAARLLSELEYEEQLVGYDMSSTSGSTRRVLYSMHEVCDFMRMEGVDDPMLRGGGGIIGYLDFAELCTWIGDVLGDQDLATAVTELTANDESYRDQLVAVRRLVRERLDQCEVMLRPVAEGVESDDAAYAGAE